MYQICTMVKVTCDTILSLQLEEKKRKKRSDTVRGWFMFRDFRTGSTNSPNTLVCNPITYRWAETLIIICYVKLGICIRSDWRGNYRSAKRICISFPRRSFPRSVYINVKLFRNRSIRWVVRAIPSDRKSIRRISENVNAMYNSS